MEAILEQLVRSPKLRLYVDELEQTLRREAAERTRFRESLDEDVRAEFINGEVVEYVTSREKHNATVHFLVTLIGMFARTRGLGVVRSEQALVGTTRNDYAPDVAFWSAAKAAAFVGELTIYPVPDFIAEVVSPSTEARDRGVKFEDYAAHGVREYWLVDPDARTIEQYLLAGDRYQLALKVREGVIQSAVIEGLAMPVAAAFDDDANLQALRD